MKKLDQKNLGDILALTPLQEGMLFHYLKEPGTHYYFEQLSLEMSGEINADHFENAWNFVIQTNEMLRTIFRWEDVENPVQMVLKEHPLHPKYYDFSSQDTEKKKKRLEELKVEDRNNPFDLTGVPFRVYLCKTGSASFEMIISYHHILYDGWSNGIILEEFLAAYNDLCAGTELNKPAKTKFKEFVAWLQNADRGKEDRYWSNYLYEFDTPTELSIKKRNKGERIIAANFQTRFDKPIKDKIEDFVKTQKITAASLFYCSWGILLQRYNNNDDVVFGTTVSGRPTAVQGIERMVGLFINTIPLRIKNFPGEKISDLLHRLNDALEEREAYENTSLVEINKLSMPRCEGAGEELFDSIVVIENYPMENRWNKEKNGLTIKSYSMIEATHYDLTLGIMLLDEIEINFNYSEQAFEEEDIKCLAGRFSRIMHDIMAEPGKEISQIEMLSEEEKNRLIYEWNNTEKPYPQDKTIHGLFVEQVERTPDNIALSGHSVRLVRPVGLSYRELNEQSNGLARLLGEKGVGPDTIVGIMMERSVEMIIGILGILKSGGAYLPIDPQYPQERIDYMLKDSNARILLGMEENQKKIIVNCQLLIVNCKLLMGSPQAPLHHSSFIVHHSNHLSYVIYTSGSTGEPKGVMIEHMSLVNFIFSMYRDYREDFGSTDNCLSLANFCFDPSVCEIFMPLVFGASIVLLAYDKVLDPWAIAGLIIEKSITFTYIPPGLLREVYEYLKIGLQGSGSGLGLNKMLVGVEPIQDYVLEDYLKLNPALRIINGYGPTEATICATAYRYESHDPEGRRVPIGRPLANMAVLLLDKYYHPAPVGLVGELYIGGDDLARGYLNRPELTAERFNRSYRTYMPYIFYKTGDLARRLADGNIEFLGRMDFQVKIRGYRVEPGEIENRLLSHKNIKEAVVLAKDWKNGDNEDKYLCAYVTGLTSLKEPELRVFLAKDLPAYMIPAYFVFLEKIPLTPNGKVDRRALPEPEFTVREAYTPAGNEMEERLVKLWSEVLSPSTPAGRLQIGIDDNFFRLGGHSLNAAKLVLKIHKESNVKIPVNALFENPTIRELAKFIKRTKQDFYIPIEEVEKREYYPLSAAQKRLFITQYMESEGLGYNVQNLVQLEGMLSPQGRERLENTFRELIRRHENLRTSFEIIADEPMQRIHEEVEFKLGARDQGSGVSRGEPLWSPDIIKSFVRPFDLSKAPLLRVGLLQIGEETHILMIDMHHIIADALSMTIFIKEFTAFYRDEELPPLPIQYKEYAMWQNEILRNPLEKEILENQEGYWLKEFEGDIPLLNLPIDFARPTIRQYEGASVLFELDKEKAGLLKKLAAAEDMTLFMLFLSLFYVLLAKICDQEDIPVGTPIAGRKHPDLQQVMGLFINMLALRNRPTGDKSFRYFLMEVKKKTLAAYENQDYPYEELVEKVALKTKRDSSRNALFDVLFVWEDLDLRLDYLVAPGSGTGEERLELKPFKVEKINAPFDFILTGTESAETMSFFINYSTALFKRETIEKVIGNFKEVVSQILKNPNIKLADIDILPEEEKKKILVDFNATEGEYPAGKTIHQWFEEQAEKTPDYIALSVRRVRQVRQVRLSYSELNEKSGRLAGVLIRKGVQSDAIVALMVERSPEMIIGLLGILKAGGAYLPIDTSYPEERKRYMLMDSRVRLMVTDRDNRAPGCAPGEVEIIDVTDPGVYCGDGNNPPGHVGSAGDLVYLIYTSGSTGNPKGVMLEHRNVVNLIYFDFHYTNMDFSKVLQFHTIGFDASFHEIFCALLSGGELCLIDEDTRLDIPGLFRVVEENRIPTVFLPMSFLRIIFNDDHYVRVFPRCVRHIQTAGEQVFINRLFRGFLQENHVYLHNHYGPSETHVVTALTLDPDGDIPELPTIGKPILNSSIYILDKERHLLPVGAPGEIYIGGIQVGRGYLFRPELTAEKFIKSFSGGGGGRFFKKAPLLYRTGDLARWKPDGNIEFLGRIDTQVKIRGFRIEPGEIESKLTDIDYIKEAVVIDRVDGNDEKYLCAYVVSDVEINPGELRGILSKTLPDYMLPSYFMRLEQILLSPNGKVKRDALPSVDVAKLKKSYIAPRDEVERKLCRLWAEALGMEQDSIGIEDNFFELGGHSLKATILIAKMHKAFNVKIILGELFNQPTIKGLVQLIKTSAGESFKAIEPVEKKEYYPMSSAQKRMYILNQLERDSISYNMPAPMIIEGNVDKEKLAAVFRELIRRQEGLRTGFVVVDGEPVQKIEETVEFKIEILEIGRGDPTWSPDIIKSFVRPFDLSKAPLMRVGLARLEEEKYLLIVDFHHIIGDGVSLGVMIREFTRLYEGETVQPLPVQYKDYAVWQQGMTESSMLKRQEEYWLNQLSADIQPLDLPLDYPRPAMMSFEGRWVEFEIPAATAGKLKTLAEHYDATLYMALLTAYNVLLHKYTGQETIVVGSAIAGRSHPDLENIVGVFLNTLVMKNNPADGLTFVQFLQQVRENALRAYENQDFQFEELVEKLNIKRDYSRNPIFDTMLNFINMDIPEIKLRDLKLTPYKIKNTAVKFDFKINAWEQDDMVRCTLDYCTKLFKPETMDIFIEKFLEIIDKIGENPRIKIAEISLISKEVEKKMVEDFNEEIAAEF